jgi:hypothetical protein
MPAPSGPTEASSFVTRPWSLPGTCSTYPGSRWALIGAVRVNEASAPVSGQRLVSLLGVLHFSFRRVILCVSPVSVQRAKDPL